jgi:hypothetical protein
MYFDIFNGDADGVCALIQLRLHCPQQATLVTGVKRDIQLLDKVTVNSGDQLTVLDISFQKNKSQVGDFLSRGAHIFYVDHHQSGDIPTHPHLTTLIDTDPNVCTSVLVNRYLQGKYPLWAIVAAFGDNLRYVAEQLAVPLSLKINTLQRLENLGIYVNYNSYGHSISDLHFSPEQLYQNMVIYPSPVEFIHDQSLIFDQLAAGYHDDMSNAQVLKPMFTSSSVNVFMLPDTVWARRVSGVFGNYLANLYPTKAHAILSHHQENDYQISIRAPLSNTIGADVFCTRFPTGGGRKAAAGINHLPKDELSNFIRQFDRFYSTLKPDLTHQNQTFS